LSVRSLRSVIRPWPDKPFKVPSVLEIRKKKRPPWRPLEVWRIVKRGACPLGGGQALRRSDCVQKPGRQAAYGVGTYHQASQIRRRALDGARNAGHHCRAGEEQSGRGEDDGLTHGRWPWNGAGATTLPMSITLGRQNSRRCDRGHR